MVSTKHKEVSTMIITVGLEEPEKHKQETCSPHDAVFLCIVLHHIISVICDAFLIYQYFIDIQIYKTMCYIPCNDKIY